MKLKNISYKLFGCVWLQAYLFRYWWLADQRTVTDLILDGQLRLGEYVWSLLMS